MEDITHLSDNVQNCLNDIFGAAYMENESYAKSLVEVACYLVDDSDKYDDVLNRNKYVGIDKSLLNQMILSNFLELTYYRRKSGFKLDEVRLNILNAVESLESDDDDIAALLHCDIGQFAMMLNDVFFYFWHTSIICSYNIVKSMIEDGFSKKLYQIYPLAVNEHILTLDDEFSEKEYLLYTLTEIMVSSYERMQFASGKDVIPDEGFLPDIRNKLKKYNGRNAKLPNLHAEILKEFNLRTGITPGENYDKILMLEIVSSIVQTKHSWYIPESKEERHIMERLNLIDFSLESISNFYDKNEATIISTIIDNWNVIPEEEMLLDTKLFERVKERESKSLKKRF